MESINPFPAPWKLRGSGYLFIFKFPKSFKNLPDFLPQSTQLEYHDGFGTMMLVDYHESNAGPYRELLLIPGIFSWSKCRAYSISKIFVSTQQSVLSGQKNWGIPKELADFKIEKLGKDRERWRVSQDGREFFDATVSHRQIPIPIHTAFLPSDLIQEWEGKIYQTQIKGFGLARVAELAELSIYHETFPDISDIHPVIGFQIKPFQIIFPEAEVTEVTGTEAD
jgi:hypothetical protein